MGSNLHFYRYATTTGGAGASECPYCGGPNDHGDDCRNDHHGAFRELIGAPPASQTGGTVPFNRADGLGLSSRRDRRERDLELDSPGDESARFYTWIWRELVDRGLLELAARLAVR